MTTTSGLQIDSAIVHLRSADPVLAGLLDQYVLQEPAGEEQLFHALVRAIVNQQLSGKAAETILRRVEQLVAQGGELTPEQVIATDQEALRGAGLSNAKARYVRGLAEAVLSGELDLQRLPGLSDEEVIEQLTHVKGIGRWTAEMILLFSLRRPNVLSTGDLGIRNAVKRHYGLEAVPSPDELRVIAEPWHPYCSTALLLLWHSLDNRPEIDAGEVGGA